MRTKTDLVSAISAKTGLASTDVKAVIDTLPEVAAESLRNEEACILPGFGTLKVNHRGARKGRNPQTGEPIDIAASKTVSLKPGKKLKSSI